jgi:hypothetical protein
MHFISHAAQRQMATNRCSLSGVAVVRPAIFSASPLAAAPELRASRTWTGLATAPAAVAWHESTSATLPRSGSASSATRRYGARQVHCFKVNQLRGTMQTLQARRRHRLPMRLLHRPDDCLSDHLGCSGLSS